MPLAPTCEKWGGAPTLLQSWRGVSCPHGYPAPASLFCSMHLMILESRRYMYLPTVFTV